MRELFFCLALLSSGLSLAQEEANTLSEEIINYADSTYFELGGQLGSLLPFGVGGVKETYPLTGFLFSHPTPYGNLEYLFNAAQAKGVTWQEALLSLRIDFNVYDFFSGYFRLGAQATRFQRASTEDGTAFDFVTRFGSHFGFGSYLQMAGPYWGRVDFKFGFGPGNTLNVTAGLVYRW